jgi:2-C-methyl-D-erythritol 4-phosphate cytidylyltransferase
VSTVAIIAAAGAGSRLARANGTPKALLPLGGRPMLQYSVDAALSSGAVDGVVLVVPDGTRELVVGLVEPSLLHAVVPGGPSRQASIRAGIAALPSDVTVVVCHDAARPFASADLFARVVRGLGFLRDRVDGVVPVVAPADTVKLLVDDLVAETIPRERVGLAQTPQAFDPLALREGHERALAAGFEATDDAMILEWSGRRVGVVDGEAGNFKVTSAGDLVAAERILAGRP